jgi:hypothetical protein
MNDFKVKGSEEVMRKTFILMFLIISCVALISGSAYAISGVCSNCHTMHYSQNGTILSDWGTSGPYGYLLLDSCIGCHTGPTGSATNTHGAPIVLRTGDPGGQGGTYTLAGGDFWWVHQGSANDSKGHNVEGLAGLDTNIVNDGGRRPPGWDPAATSGLSYGQINNGGATWTQQLRCAGEYGCHGVHYTTTATADAGIFGSHHSNIGGTGTQADGATTVGGSYRFLGGINGKEYTNWNWGETPSFHNEYYGVNGNVSYATKTTISYSCAECHGFFHSSIGTASPWLRHPTDIVLPDTAGKEYSKYNPEVGGGGNTYNLEAPVARGSVPTSSHSGVSPGTSTGDTSAIVMCLSCHRAHGSPESDILRWTYSGMQAGSGTSDTGCFVCHTCKNADCP